MSEGRAHGSAHAGDDTVFETEGFEGGGGVLVSGRRTAEISGVPDLARVTTFCLACGVPQEPSPNCSSCGRPRAVAPPESLTAGAVRVGYLGRSPSAPPGVAVDLTPGSTSPIAITSAGELRKLSTREFHRLSTVEGLRPLQSRAAAVLLVLHQPPDRRFKGSTQALEGAASLVLGVDDDHVHDPGPLAIARRAAAGLAALGVTEPLMSLGFTDDELTWWTALGHLNGGELREAVTTLARLPPGRYPLAVGLLLWCSRRVGADLGGRVRALVTERLEAGRTMRQVGAAVDAAGLQGPVYDWLWSAASLATMPHDPPEFESAALDTLRVLAGGALPMGPMTLPEGATDALIDDLITRGATIDAASIAELRPGSKRYVLARTDPDELSDAEVAELQFTDEQLRRALEHRRPYAPAARHDPALAALVQLATGGGFDARLLEWSSQSTAGKHVLLTELRTFLERGDLDCLTPDLTADTSLWPLIADRLGTGQLLDGLRSERADMRLLAWAALSRSKERLQEADWTQAFELAREALRGQPPPELQAEAYNLMACACWQTHRDDKAHEALDAALTAAPNSSLQINLAIVAAALDPQRASVDLARLVTTAPTLDLRSAAALRAVSVWTPDAMPWHDVPNDMPEQLAISLRTLVNEDIDLELFRGIVKMQSVTDGVWLGRSGSLTSSLHGRTLEARMFRARALGPMEFVNVLAEATRRDEPPEWVAAEIADTVRILRRCYRRQAAPVPQPEDSILALAMIERGLPLQTTDNIVLVPLAIPAVSDRAEPEGLAPDDWCAVSLADYEQAAHRSGVLIDLRGIYNHAWNRLGMTLALYHRRRLLAAAERFGRAKQRLGRMPTQQRIDAAGTVLDPVLHAAADGSDALEQVLVRVTDPEAKRFLGDVVRVARALEADANTALEVALNPQAEPARRRGVTVLGGDSEPELLDDLEDEDDEYDDWDDDEFDDSFDDPGLRP